MKNAIRISGILFISILAFACNPSSQDENNKESKETINQISQEVDSIGMALEKKTRETEAEIDELLKIIEE